MIYRPSATGAVPSRSCLHFAIVEMVHLVPSLTIIFLLKLVTFHGYDYPTGYTSASQFIHVLGELGTRNFKRFES